jgi:putative ABC transport system substrate-binding protein
MMKNIFPIFLLLSLVLPYGTADAEQKIVAVQSLKIKPYEEALKGFQSVCNVKTEDILISGQEEAEIVKEIRRIKPDMILAFGVEALSKVKKIKDVPIVYLMVLNPPNPISKQENITGVSMNIPPEKQLGLLQEILHEVKRVGLLYDPAKTGYLVEKARHSAERLGIKLVIKEVHNSRDVPSTLDSMRDGIDAFWMLPDTTVVTPETVESLFLFSLENRISVLTFSDKYLELGAMISVGVDAFDIGRQAGEMAKEILSGSNIKNLPRVDAQKAILTLNLKVAKKLGIRVNTNIAGNVRIVE